MRTTFAIALIACSAIGAHAAPRQTAASAAPSPSSPQRALLTKYCVTCHNQKLRTAGLTLDTVDSDRVGANADVWEMVVRKLRARAMPPVGVPRPDTTASDSLASWLETALDRAAAASPNPGQPAAVHRLNRAEYTNAIRDLLSLEIDGNALLPVDDAGYGFDNIADVLSVSPALLDRYMAAAQKIARLAVGNSSIPVVFETYAPLSHLRQDDRIDELPLGSRGGMAIHHRFPLDAEYELTVELHRNEDGDIQGLTQAYDLDVRLNGERITQFKVGDDFKNDESRGAWSDYEHHADDALTVRFSAKAGPAVVGVAFRSKGRALVADLRPARWPTRSAAFNASSSKYDVEPFVRSVTIKGPYAAAGPGDTPSRRRIFACRPTSVQDEEACATKILSTLARRAYRRPVTTRDVETLLGFYRTRPADAGFDAGIEMALRRMLVSPSFLFRVERVPPDVPAAGVYRLSDLDLASRLSFFLWSSIPDEQLLDAAERGRLSDPAVLNQQVRRMLADSRSASLVKNFGGQWLYLRNLRTVNPNNKVFPDFDDSLRQAFQRETEMFLESQLREDRGVDELLTANYTFVNEQLARHYGIPNVYGSQFRRVTFKDDHRGGLLGQASILTVTSYATRTSPTRRGKWVLENILGSPPPPPPPNVPDLKESGAGGKPASVRERLEQHRRNPVCAGCHARMDPLGFALENYDGIGRWRTINDDDRTAIDPSGAVPDGTKFEGPAGLRKLLAANYREEFVRTITEKLMTYALGRGLEYYDAPTIRAILRKSAPDAYRWSAIAREIAASAPFRMRRKAS